MTAALVEDDEGREGGVVGLVFPDWLLPDGAFYGDSVAAQVVVLCGTV